jgi:hypothetical protein
LTTIDKENNRRNECRTQQTPLVPFQPLQRGVPEIVKTLNAEQVAVAKIGKLNSPWNQTRIRRIVRQGRYVETVVRNRMKRVTTHPA